MFSRLKGFKVLAVDQVHFIGNCCEAGMRYWKLFEPNPVGCCYSGNLKKSQGYYHLSTMDSREKLLDQEDLEIFLTLTHTIAHKNLRR